MSNNFNDMSLKDLRVMFDECDINSGNDKPKREILKKLIRQKINQIKIFKKEEQHEKENLIDDIIQFKTHIDESHKKKLIGDKQRIMARRGNMEKYWESNQNVTMADPKFTHELETDFTNNKLMERLNTELDYRIHDNKGRRKIMDKPYAEVDCGDYASVKDFNKYSVPRDDFRMNKRFGRKK
jgi:hypothetical protein